MFACYSICYSHAELRQHSPQNRSTSQTQGPEYMVWAFKEIEMLGSRKKKNLTQKSIIS